MIYFYNFYPCFFKTSLIPFLLCQFSFFWIFFFWQCSNNSTQWNICMKFIYLKIIYWILWLCISWWYFLYAPHNLWMFMEIFLSVSLFRVRFSLPFNVFIVHLCAETEANARSGDELKLVYGFEWIFLR